MNAINIRKFDQWPGVIQARMLREDDLRDSFVTIHADTTFRRLVIERVFLYRLGARRQRELDL